MRQELRATSYALLGLLSFGEELTGYQVKQWADSTLEFYWVAPAMSQIYAELARLAELGLVVARDDPGQGGRTTRRYRISDTGLERLRAWLIESPPEFPVLKHPVALRLLLGHITGPAPMRAMLDGYAESLQRRRTELAAVREGLGDDPDFLFPALVAEWGLQYYDDEAAVVSDLARRLGAVGGAAAGPDKSPQAG